MSRSTGSNSGVEDGFRVAEAERIERQDFKLVGKLPVLKCLSVGWEWPRVISASFLQLLVFRKQDFF